MQCARTDLHDVEPVGVSPRNPSIRKRRSRLKKRRDGRLAYGRRRGFRGGETPEALDAIVVHTNPHRAPAGGSATVGFAAAAPRASPAPPWAARAAGRRIGRSGRRSRRRRAGSGHSRKTCDSPGITRRLTAAIPRESVLTGRSRSVAQHHAGPVTIPRELSPGSPPSVASYHHPGAVPDSPGIARRQTAAIPRESIPAGRSRGAERHHVGSVAILRESPLPSAASCAMPTRRRLPIPRESSPGPAWPIMPHHRPGAFLIPQESPWIDTPGNRR